MNPGMILLYTIVWAAIAFVTALAVLFVVFLTLETVKVARAWLRTTVLFKGRRRD